MPARRHRRRRTCQNASLSANASLSLPRAGPRAPRNSHIVATAAAAVGVIRAASLSATLTPMPFLDATREMSPARSGKLVSNRRCAARMNTSDASYRPDRRATSARSIRKRNSRDRTTSSQLSDTVYLPGNSNRQILLRVLRENVRVVPVNHRRACTHIQRQPVHEVRVLPLHEVF